MLIEAVLYTALFAVVLGLAMAALYSAWENHRHLSRAGKDIVRVTEAGERWRNDVRSASGPLLLEKIPEGEQLRLPQAEGEIVYRSVGDRVIRLEGAYSNELFRVRSSRMVRQETEHVKQAWLWEVELTTGQETVRVRPLFSFKAVRREKP